MRRGERRPNPESASGNSFDSKRPGLRRHRAPRARPAPPSRSRGGREAGRQGGSGTRSRCARPPPPGSRGPARLPGGAPASRPRSPATRSSRRPWCRGGEFGPARESRRGAARCRGCRPPRRGVGLTAISASSGRSVFGCSAAQSSASSSASGRACSTGVWEWSAVSTTACFEKFVESAAGVDQPGEHRVGLGYRVDLSLGPWRWEWKSLSGRLKSRKSYAPSRTSSSPTHAEYSSRVPGRVKDGPQPVALLA